MNPEKIKQLVNEIEPQLIEIRRTLHKNPELSYKEEKTAELICKTLKGWGIDYEFPVFNTGVVATINGSHKGKVIGIRADMDALPVDEKTGAPYASQTPGVMHACGHDVHVTTALGVAYVVNALKDELCGSVKFFFQPAEEAEGGAEEMIKAGCLENPHVDEVLCAHVMNTCDVGTIMVKPGPVMAAPDFFTLTVHGRGGHGAMTKDCIDPIAVASQIINALYLIPARNIDPCDPVVVSVCEIHAGSAPNVVPDECVLSGTARTFNEKTRKYVYERIKHTAESVAAGFGATITLDYDFQFPPTVNDAFLAKTFADRAGKLIGKDNVLPLKDPYMAGDDFSHFANHVPGVYFILGVKNKALDCDYPLHNPKFNVDESCIKTGVLSFLAHIFLG